MAEMTEKEFVNRFIHDKAFKRQIAAAVMGYEGNPESEHAMADWMAACGETMGYHFDIEALDREVNEQLETLSAFKKITFLGSFINAGRKVKKDKQKAEKAQKRAAK